MYAYRNLPCSVVDDDKLWCVSGGLKDGSGGGVLEWCVDEEDAQDRLALMEASGDFIRLHAHKYRES